MLLVLHNRSAGWNGSIKVKHDVSRTTLFQISPFSCEINFFMACSVFITGSCVYFYLSTQTYLAVKNTETLQSGALSKENLNIDAETESLDV